MFYNISQTLLTSLSVPYCLRREKFESEVKGPRFAKLKNWHQGLSSQILNVQE